LATPYVNSVPFSTFNPALLGVGRYVASGEKWGTTLGSAVTLTYSFPTGTAYRISNYGEEWNSWFSLDSLERSAVATALGTWSRFANVSFVQSADNSTTVGELRFAFSNTLGPEEAAHAYYPWSHPTAGDVWFNPVHFNSDGGGVPAGSYDFLIILHEVGHALGLKHPFETPNAIPAALDSLFYTIMSYTASSFSADGDNYASFYPTTPMYYDLVAIEGMYGRRAYNAGGNNYVFNDGTRYWQAIHDTGGADIITYNGVENATINLNPGAFSALSERIIFNGGTSKSTVTIGPKVDIENARGGNGNDVLIGNSLNNYLDGRNGNDALTGYDGLDYLNGGNGNDNLRGSLGNDTLVGGANNDVFVFNTAPNSSTNRDTIADYNPAQDTIQLENAIFTKLLTVGLLNPALFRLAAAPLDSNDYITYNRSTGYLFYDPNGSLAGGTVQFAYLANKPALTASEFQII